MPRDSPARFVAFLPTTCACTVPITTFCHTCTPINASHYWHCGRYGLADLPVAVDVVAARPRYRPRTVTTTSPHLPYSAALLFTAVDSGLVDVLPLHMVRCCYLILRFHTTTLRLR